ncbi:trypsin-like serine protease [Novosphingobium sp. LASN5T]|uniref:trypsin-like serine protease n=1 Tax=Novosphingobium sp. LASN5T TaxID=2491021 RepID=UPI000F5F7DF1|nr:trypsin-like serine protease [Novosphingobium sp. LASN5T]RQW38304.1 serine protease [Novosphingobium sp. LASN5T]
MSFSEEWSLPEGHPVSVERAKELMQGDLGRVHFDILARVCSPLYWHVPDDKGARPIRANGTLSYIQADGQVFGVTAAHVITDYLKVEKEPGCVLQLGNTALSADIIDMDEGLDIATLRLNAATLASVGKQIMPVSLSRPNDIPQEGRGIMMCGYPGEDRHQRPNQNVDWGMLGVIGIARRVSEDQITWIPDHDNDMPVPGIPQLPRNKNLGGISGGPLIAWFERPTTYLSYFSLAGVIKEASAELEYVVASRSHFIRPDGRIER